MSCSPEPISRCRGRRCRPGWGPGGPLPAGLLAHPDRLALRPAFVSAANASGVSPSLLEALCWWESGWQSAATSTTGAIGLCQLEPSTVTYAQTVLLHNPGLDPHVASDNIAMAAAYLHDLTVRDGGNVRTAVAAYYQGLKSVPGRGPMPVDRRTTSPASSTTRRSSPGRADDRAG